MNLSPVEIRQFMRDYPALKLVMDNNEEWSDNDIDLAMKLAESKLNSIPPYLGQFKPLNTWNEVYKTGILYLIVAELLNMRLLELSSNNIQYQSNGTGINYDSIISLYANLSEKFDQKGTQLINNLKIQENINSIGGEIPSALRGFSWW